MECLVLISMCQLKKILVIKADDTLVPKHSGKFCGQIVFRLLLLLGLALGGQGLLRAQSTSLNVTNFGARGDAVQISVAMTSNSSAVIFPASNPLTSADVGKVILLFGVGPATTPTNHQDLIASIVSVSNGTNVILSGTTNRARARRSGRTLRD